MRLTHIRLLVEDFDACFRFYRDVMGLRPTFGTEGDSYADLDTGNGVSIALFGRSEMADAIDTASLPARADRQDAGMLIFAVDDVDKAYLRATHLGAVAVSEGRDFPEWGIRAAYVRDPDGNLIELNSPVPAAEEESLLPED